MARKKFKILYPQDHPDASKRGKQFKRRESNGFWSKDMVVMNSHGVFFLFNGETYYPSIQKLCEVLPKYDVVWVGEEEQRNKEE